MEGGHRRAGHPASPSGLVGVAGFHGPGHRLDWRRHPAFDGAADRCGRDQRHGGSCRRRACSDSVHYLACDRPPDSGARPRSLAPEPASGGFLARGCGPRVRRRRSCGAAPPPAGVAAALYRLLRVRLLATGAAAGDLVDVRCGPGNRPGELAQPGDRPHRPLRRRRGDAAERRRPHPHQHGRPAAAAVAPLAPARPGAHHRPPGGDRGAAGVALGPGGAFGASARRVRHRADRLPPGGGAGWAARPDGPGEMSRGAASAIPAAGVDVRGRRGGARAGPPAPVLRRAGRLPRRRDPARPGAAPARRRRDCRRLRPRAGPSPRHRRQ